MRSDPTTRRSATTAGHRSVSTRKASLKLHRTAELRSKARKRLGRSLPSAVLSGAPWRRRNPPAPDGTLPVEDTLEDRLVAVHPSSDGFAAR